MNPKIATALQERGLKVVSGKEFTATTDNLLFNLLTEVVDLADRAGAETEEIILDEDASEYIEIFEGTALGAKFLYYSKNSESEAEFYCALYIVE